MRKSLEDFIKENRGAFDSKNPSDNVWNSIQRKLFPKISLWNSVTLWRAAAVLFMGLSIYLLLPKFAVKQQQQVALKEFSDVEAFYVKQISEKVDLIYEYRGADKGLNGFTEDFKQLEAMYYVLKEQMKAQPSQKVKDALVLNLLVRIDLLNQQLHEIESGNENENEKSNQSSI